jgi:hypothetical protein
LRGQRAVEETEGRREDRGPSRGQRAIEGTEAVEETEGGRASRWLLRKQRVIERIQGRRGNRAP